VNNLPEVVKTTANETNIVLFLSGSHWISHQQNPVLGRLKKMKSSTSIYC